MAALRVLFTLCLLHLLLLRQEHHSVQYTVPSPHLHWSRPASNSQTHPHHSATAIANLPDGLALPLAVHPPARRGPVVSFHQYLKEQATFPILKSASSSVVEGAFLRLLMLPTEEMQCAFRSSKSRSTTTLVARPEWCSHNALHLTV